MKEKNISRDPVIENRQARFKYQIFETFEAGIVLKGNEIKSLRNSQVSLQEGYVHVHRGEVLMEGVHITPYSHQSTHVAVEPVRSIKLLLHKKEISHLASEAKLKKQTIVPLKVYFKKGYAKILIGLARGKKSHDKREDIKQKDVQRKLDRINR